MSKVSSINAKRQMKNALSEIGQYFTKESTYIIGMSIGLLGKLSYEIYKKRALTVIQWLAVVGMSVFSGYMVSLYCKSNNLGDSSQYLVPIGTLLGEKIFIYIFTNYKSILTGIFNLIIKPK
jgi:hypothetical protein